MQDASSTLECLDSFAGLAGISQEPSGESSTPEFVKKLFCMLQDNSYPHILSWGTSGETFVVKEPSKFAQRILPKHFKHSNFSSFVRQLNKYDFHKIRNTEDGHQSNGSQIWEFRHSNFKCNQKHLLEAIKRKPSGRSNSQSLQQAALPNGPSRTKPKGTESPMSEIKTLQKLAKMMQDKLGLLQQEQSMMTSRLQATKHRYGVLMGTLATLRSSMGLQDSTVQTMMRRAVLERKALCGRETRADEGYRIQALESIAESHTAVVQTSESQMAELWRHLECLQCPLLESTGLHCSASTSASSIASSTHSTPNPACDPLVDLFQAARGWAVQPRILVVDDDSIFRSMATRMLQFAGCTIEVAVDGLEAISKLRADRYDMVLMDIMMPNMDGISATRNIRTYDSWTPIVSVTASQTTADIQHCLDSGMNGCLCKPLDQHMVLGILDHFCTHLRLGGLEGKGKQPSAEVYTLPVDKYAAGNL
ncbi:HSF-type DNA-binding-domain-containing protein [Phycomyces nitens]|nr:HSF-type DNA-binding-domain-containing protein [Phycomyces nitens]